ncbi:MAG: hypothetical protein R6X20_18280 [Phycisphaerae bacterium]
MQPTRIARFPWLAGVAGVLLGAAALAAAAPPEAEADAEARAEAEKAAKVFEALYGQDVARARGTADVADDVALAKRLVAAAVKAKDQPALLAVLCDRAYALASPHADGYATAVEAVVLLRDEAPSEAAACTERLVEVRQRQYAAAGGKEKAAAGAALVDAMLALTQYREEAGALPQAVSLLKRAARIAKAAGGDRLAEIEIRQERAEHLVRTHRDIRDMKALLDRDPDNAAARGKLVRLCLVHLDDPSRAAEHLKGVEDEALAKYVPAAAKGIEAAPELACLQLGDWYRTLGETAPAPFRRAMFDRSKAYYARFLSLHAAEDLDRTSAELALRKIDAAIAALDRSATSGTTAGGGETKEDPEEIGPPFGAVGDAVTHKAQLGHRCQVWPILPTHAVATRYRVSVRHAAPGPAGAFHIMAVADVSGDGVPDTAVGVSPLCVAKQAGEWSSWEFRTRHKRLFVGNCWRGRPYLYYRSAAGLGGYVGLGSEIYYARTFGSVPTSRTAPRYTNIRVQALREKR